jgi:hypothetical protein
MKIDFLYITPQDALLTEKFSVVRNLNEITDNDDDNILGKTENLILIFENTVSDYILLQIENKNVLLDSESFNLFSGFAEKTKGDFIYSGFVEIKSGKHFLRNVNEYQEGSVRDDFEFGALVLIKRDILGKYLESAETLEFSAFYDFRLFVSCYGKIEKIPNMPSYFVSQDNSRKTGEEVFDYVKKEYRKVQIEREKVFTKHLKEIGAYLPKRIKTVEFEFSNFPVTASVIIPVKNREKTIAEAVNSALNQKTDFDFNVIVVDNFSTDGTTQILADLQKDFSKLIVIKPEADKHGIGGCWNIAIEDKRCGAFAIQLDSDDVYSDENSLQKIVDEFLRTNSAAVVGSYVVTDFNLNEIPPGKVLHEEWTDENGHNNALRINGFGAPRAYYTDVIRKIKFPDVSYGEDYAVMLAITREFRIARIYEPLYFARRWSDNSDADLNWEDKIKFNFQKDLMRTNEIKQRKLLAKNN